MSFHIAHLPVDVVGVLESTWEDDNNDSADAPNVVLHNRDDESDSNGIHDSDLYKNISAR